MDDLSEARQNLEDTATVVVAEVVKALLPFGDEELNNALMLQAVSATAGALCTPGPEAARELNALLEAFSIKWRDRVISDIVRDQINEGD